MNKSKDLIENKRGIETLEMNDTQILVKASIDRVSQAFFEVRQAANLRYNVYNDEIEVTDLCFIIYQLKKHLWTLIKTENCELSETYLNCKDAQLLSNKLQTKAIFYSVSDNPIDIHYHLYINGDSTEKFSFYYEHNDVCEDFDELDELDESVYKFESNIRQIQDSDMKDEFTFVDKFFKDNDAYVLPIKNMCERGKTGIKVPLGIIGYQDNDFERMDYISVK